MIAKWLDIHVFMFNLEKGDWYLSIENLFSSKLVTLTNLFRRQHFTLLLLFKTQKMTMVLHQGLTFARQSCLSVIKNPRISGLIYLKLSAFLPPYEIAPYILQPSSHKFVHIKITY
jgi:hypothetical protein